MICFCSLIYPYTLRLIENALEQAPDPLTFSNADAAQLDKDERVVHECQDADQLVEHQL